MGDRTRVRSPLVEGLLVAGQGVLAAPGRSLTPTEQLILQDVFGSSINYDAIRIALTGIGAEGRPYTLGNTIRVPPNTSLTPDVLVHEVTHVWQYQTKGSGYISDSGWHQITEGDNAYQVKLVPGQSIHGYSAEQQAVIVQIYYIDRQRNPTAPATRTKFSPATDSVPVGWSKNPDVLRMIEEVKRARPMSATDITQERLFGPGWNSDTENSPSSNRTEVLPLLRIEF